MSEPHGFQILGMGFENMTNNYLEPVIIIGAARSGTKFLRDLLAAPAGVKAVPYDVNYVWRYGVVNCPDDRLDHHNISNRQASFIRKTIRKLAKAKPDDILIEKTVSNTLRVPYIDKVFPQARYVHLIRDGRDVTESAMRLWQAPPDWKALRTKLRSMPLSNIGYIFWFAKNFFAGLGSGRKGGKIWGPRFPGVDAIAEKHSLAEICALQWKHSVETATEDLRSIPDERVFNIRYEDLITDAAALSNLIGQLGLPGEEKIIAAWAEKLRPSAPALWEKLCQKDQDDMLNVLATTLAEKEYL